MGPENLQPGDGFQGLFSLLLMDSDGRFVRRDASGVESVVSPEDLPDYLDRKIILPRGVTDVFVWVHGWRTDRAAAVANAKRMFLAIESVYRKRKPLYASLDDFVPGFVAVSWPSDSLPTPGGYQTIR